MRNSISNMVNRTILFKYNLPYSHIGKSSITTSSDKCYAISSNENLADLIYNGIVEYAIGERHVDINNLDLCQRKAIKTRLKYDEAASDEEKLKYGFYGEVVLDIILQYTFSSNVLLAKGYFYNPLDDSEPKGYDSYQFYYNTNNQLSLLLGEVKFYKSFELAIKKILDNLDKATSTQYFQKNVLALITEQGNFDLAPKEVATIIEAWENNPEINLYEEIKKYNVKLHYPILVLYNELSDSYDETIKLSIDKLNKEISKRNICPEIEIELFFMLIPVDSAQKIKEQVISWISQVKPLE